jgi:hypothetical protein
MYNGQKHFPINGKAIIVENSRWKILFYKLNMNNTITGYDIELLV